MRSMDWSAPAIADIDFIYHNIIHCRYLLYIINRPPSSLNGYIIWLHTVRSKFVVKEPTENTSPFNYLLLFFFHSALAMYTVGFLPASSQFRQTGLEHSVFV